MEYLAWFLLACGLMFFYVPLATPIARALGLLDVPGGRKWHLFPTPKSGGLAFGATILTVAAVAWAVLDVRLPTGLLVGSLILLAMGLWDDQHHVPAILRLSGQTVAGLCMTQFDGLQLHSLGDLLGTGPLDLGIYAQAVTVFAVVGGINCINMLDGMDGLSGSIALTVVLGLLLIAGAATPGLGMPACLLAGVLVAFLCYNHPQLRSQRRLVFLGEAGTNLLGFWLAWLLVAAAERGTQPFPPVSAVWLMLIPLGDTLCLMLRRALEGRSPFSADRKHVHHLLLERLGSERVVVWCLLLVSVFGAVVAYGTARSWWSEPVAFYAFVAVLAAHSWRSWRQVVRIKTLRPSLPGET